MMTLTLNIYKGNLNQSEEWIYSPCPAFMNEIPMDLILSESSNQVISFLNEFNKNNPINPDFIKLAKEQTYIIEKKFILSPED